MAIPEDDALLIAEWCKARVPDHLRDQVRVECEIGDADVTIVESRPPWDGSEGDWTPSPIARLRHAASTNLWSLYWMDSNYKYRLYDDQPPSRDVQTLLDVIEADPDGVFWG